jgi:hypothetical protein
MLDRRLYAKLFTAVFVVCTYFVAARASAQATQIKPRFLIVVDTSLSMDEAAPANTCGYPATKMGAARCSIKNVLNSIGDAEFGLMQFAQVSCGGTAGTCNQAASSSLLLQGISSNNTATLLTYVDNAANPELCAGGLTPLGGVLAGARSYFTAPTSPTATDTAASCRPLNVILLTDGVECCGSCQPGGCPNAAADTLTYLGAGNGITCQTACINVGTCANTIQHSETAPERAYELYNMTTVPIPMSGTLLKHIKTYPIGFGVTAGDVRIENIAKAGHTNAPGGFFANYATDEATLSAALNQIILDSQLTEVCDGVDNDCDERVDEGYAKYCDIDGLRTSNGGQPNVPACPSPPCAPVDGEEGRAVCAQPEWASSSMCSPHNLLCADPGEICDQSDDDCDGRVDEGATPTSAQDTCDLIDNDCDGQIDEDCNPNQCTPEICDGIDNNCIGGIDEGLSRQCGTDTGSCTSGLQTCQNGQWGAPNPSPGGSWQAGYCPDVSPTTELCNNVDDNCDGVIDQITRPCSPYGNTLECLAGVETCIAGVWQSTGVNAANMSVMPSNPSACLGARGPSLELCDGKDNDCMPGTADGSADTRVGKSCGNTKGICLPGITVCTAGNVVCNDLDESTSETCDGLDNDCDGKIDENSPPLPGVGDDCFPNLPDPPVVVGECETGTKACIAGNLVCLNYKGPSAEICDSLDNDCNAGTPDGAADPALNQVCGTSIGECDPGINACTAGMIVCMGDQGPVDEECDGKDNDCDNVIDEQLPDDSPKDGTRDVVSCGSGVGLCEPGELTCVPVPTNVDPDGFDYGCVGGVHSVPELCDGEDNDCDGATDECAGDHSSAGYLDCQNAAMGPLGAGGGQTCGNPVAPCSTGKTKCVADVDGQGHPGFVCVGNVDGGPELCNLLDDDCDTKIDEDLDPVNDPRLGQACDQSMVGACRDGNSQPCGKCRFGTQVCVMGNVECIGAIAPATYEKCNQADDDCDDKIDECVAPNAPNCAGQIDPNTLVGTPCGVNSGACVQGINACVNGSLVCQNSVGLGVELCNGQDDDCDVLIDEGFPVGAPCGSSVGECQPGGLVCPSNGMLPLDCVGGVLPSDEVCDALDNDCDGMVDEGLGLGEACGSNTGECKSAKLACVGGRSVCAGEIGPQPETCDCRDNDCDGKIDEESSTDPLCPGGSTCQMCQCAFPCDSTQEFAQCPQGKAAVTSDKGCYCVGELCKDADCRKQTISVNDKVQCAPNSDAVGNCYCKNNECTFSCSGVQCDQALVCDPTDGRCKQKSCLLPQFRCPDDQRCSLLDDAWQCVGDACASADCGSDQACRAGTCLESCANVVCAGGNRCKDGACLEDKCATVSCESGLTCNPTDGACVPAGICASSGCPSGQICEPLSGGCTEDVCLSTRCPYGQKCNSDIGQCELRCAGSQLFCDGDCVNPAASRVHCGATGDCQGDNAGAVCPKGQVCSLGTCSTSCADNLVDCGGDCIDPRTDMQHCGAKTDCQGGNDGEVCSVGSKCVDGTCTSIAVSKPEPAPNFRRVLASGGGGCACNVSVGADASGHSRRGLPSIAFLLFGIALLGRRRFFSRASRHVGAAKMWLAALTVWIATTFGSGCKVDTFCLDCPDPKKDAGVTGESGASGGGESGGTGGAGSDGGQRDPDASTSTSEDAAIDAALAQPDGGCTTIELCNGIDDDCDGKLDEDADPALLNIDVKTNVNHCGGCGHTCAIDHAFNQCAGGVCQIDRNKGDQGCDVGFRDLDGQDANGCEYRCVKRNDQDTKCDLVDNDCDGKIDEDVDLNTDAHNCGSCGDPCSFAHASEGGTCVDKTCVLDDQKCDDGYASVDDKAENGCEYHCPVWPTVVETCNGLDDDCDGVKDEDVTNATDVRIGIACGSPTGACDPGIQNCVDGLPTCVGDIRPQPEVCDGIDNNCDGNADTDDPDIGQPCGVAYPGSQCSRGTLQIPVGGCQTLQALVCAGGQGPTAELCNGLDDDCDGQADEAEGGAKPEEGQKCINGVNGAEVVTDDPAQWNSTTICRTGSTACESGNLVCRNEVPPAAVELCDNVDQNCDGNPLDGFVPDSPGGTTTITGPDTSIGKSCGIDTGECAFGVRTCHLDTKTSSCDNQILAMAEICDGKDNDCDGKIDETDAMTGTKPVGVMLPCIVNSLGVMQYGANVMATSPCVAGTTVCVAGQVACSNYQGPTTELCDAIDQDCDSVLNEASFPGDTRINAACDTDSNTTGVCNTGVQYCDVSGPAPTIRCMGEVFASPDLCDGLDNDCNSSTADGSAETWLNDACSTNSNGSVNLSPAAPLGICTLGTAVCLGGIQQCVNETGPQLETCDVTAPGDLANPAYDQNCNGMVDEDFQLQSNASRCGTCSNNCTTGQPNANMVCTTGACQISSCKVGYYDDKRTPTADCSLHDGVDCTFGGLEVCDGQDNDCDGLADESPVGQPLALPAANQFCLQVGACAGSSVQCKLHKIGDVANTSCTGSGDVTCVTEPVCTIRPTPELCDAPYNLETSAAYDNDCDGQSDSVEFNLTAACAFTGMGAIGACATVGNRACDLSTMAPTDTFCANGSGQPVTVGTAGSESTCNDTDDDCDGKVDEACGLVTTTGSCVTDAWVPIPNTSSSIYAYEASRPDATASGSGTKSSRACSVAGRLPWGNLTWDEAEAACEATDPTGRLCTEEEWQTACEVVDGNATSVCAWSFASSCSAWVADTCNGLDYVASEEPEPTGWTGVLPSSSNCYRPHSGSNVFDLSGNMKEYVDLRSNGTIPVRGGASNNAQDGLKCNFNYTVWPNQNVAKFPNVGFRCCRGPRCLKYNSGTALNDNSGDRDITSTITVAGSNITNVSKVAVTVRGSNGDVDDLVLHLIHGATDRVMVDLTPCNDTVNVNPYSLTFDSAAASAPTVATTCGFLSGGGSFQPAQNFSSFNGSAADGTWQFYVDDNDMAETNNVTSWSLWVCGD